MWFCAVNAPAPVAVRLRQHRIGGDRRFRQPDATTTRPTTPGDNPQAGTHGRSSGMVGVIDSGVTSMMLQFGVHGSSRTTVAGRGPVAGVKAGQFGVHGGSGTTVTVAVHPAPKASKRHSCCGRRVSAPQGRRQRVADLGGRPSWQQPRRPPRSHPTPPAPYAHKSTHGSSVESRQPPRSA